MTALACGNSSLIRRRGRTPTSPRCAARCRRRSRCGRNPARPAAAAPPDLAGHLRLAAVPGRPDAPLRAGQTGRPPAAEQGRRHAAGRAAGDPLAAAPRPGRGPAPRPGPGPDPGADQPARPAAHRQGGQHGQRHPAAQRRRQDRGPAGRGPRHGHRAHRKHSGRGTTAELPPRLAVAEVRGYPGQARKAASLLAGVPGVSHASQSVFTAALTALGRHPADYTSGVDGGDHRHHARAGRRGPAAAAAARHPGAERRRGAPRHRHRVPARPAGRGPPHPVGDQAARRGAARRPGRALTRPSSSGSAT